MIKMRLTDAARIAAATVRPDPAGDGGVADARDPGGASTVESVGEVEFNGLSTDTRSIPRGALFVALRGEHFDGHDYLEAALAGGAVAALVETPCAVKLTQLICADTRVALGALARAWRQQHAPIVIGVTGSNGKTTVKEMVRSIASMKGETLATSGNLNNDIGVPLTLNRLRVSHRYAVIEMGANHAGEIRGLAQLALPSIGVVTQCAPAHLEGFGSIEGVAHAKGELIQQLPADGVAIINADDAFALLWREFAAPRRVIEFRWMPKVADADGRAQRAVRVERVEVSATGGAEGTDVRLSLPDGTLIDLTLQLLGTHNAINAAAAAAACWAAGIDSQAIADGLARVRPVPGRMQAKPGRQGLRLIDDTYNANPASVRAAMEVLANVNGERWVVLGDMAELGPDARQLHAAAGAVVKEHGIERLYTVGAASAFAAESFGANAHHFESQDALVCALLDSLDQCDCERSVTVLLKGSRSAQMEIVTRALVLDASEKGVH